MASVIYPSERARAFGRALAVLALLVAICAAYSSSLDAELQFDDSAGIVRNPAVKDLGRLLTFGPTPGLRASARPVTDLTFALNYRASELAVRPYHVVNIGLHLVMVLALLALTVKVLRRARWQGALPVALATAALFALHPLQSQAVTYVSQRAEVLASLFYVLAILLALEAGEHGFTFRGISAYAGALAALVLGWGSKPIVATVPAAMFLFAAAFPEPGSASARELRRLRMRRLLASLPFWALAGVFSVLLFSNLHGRDDAGFDIPAMGWSQYALTQPSVILTYLRLLAWPAGQNLDWAFQSSASLLEPVTALAAAGLATILGAAGWLWRWSGRPGGDRELRSLARLAAFGVYWFFLLLAPTSSIVPLADVMEEHRVYLASWGLFLPVAASAALCARRLAPTRRGSIAAVATALAVFAVLGTGLFRRNTVWQTNVSLWTDVVTKSPRKARAHLNLGVALFQQGDAGRALAEYRVAMELMPDPSLHLDDLMLNMSGLLIDQRRYEEAIRLLSQTVASAPSSPELLYNRALAHFELGHLEQVRDLASRIVEQWPLFGPAHNALGELAYRKGDYLGARAHFEQAVAIDPDSLPPLYNLALAQEHAGDIRGACRSWARYAGSGAAFAAREEARRRFTALHCIPD